MEGILGCESQRRLGEVLLMTDDRDADEILADPSHPIWKICLALVGVLAAAWGVSSGAM